MFRRKKENFQEKKPTIIKVCDYLVFEVKKKKDLIRAIKLINKISNKCKNQGGFKVTVENPRLEPEDM